MTIVIFKKYKIETSKPVFQILKKLYKITEYLLIIFLAGIILITFIPTLPFSGGSKLYTVLSGSMEPAIKVGSLILSKPVNTDELKEGDVITFEHPEIDNQFVTHRIYQIKEEEKTITIENEEKVQKIKYFVTKGDANDREDGNKIYPNYIKGRYTYQVPYLGYVSEFVKSRNGFVLLIVLPCLFIIITEAASIIKLIQQHYKNKFEQELKKREHRNKPAIIENKKRSLKKREKKTKK